MHLLLLCAELVYVVEAVNVEIGIKVASHKGEFRFDAAPAKRSLDDLMYASNHPAKGLTGSASSPTGYFDVIEQKVCVGMRLA